MSLDIGEHLPWVKGERDRTERRPLPPIDRCEKCFHEVPMTDDLTGKYCPECGHKHPDMGQRIEARKQPRCPICRAEKQHGKFCMECGKRTKKRG